jgi:hypothetical protein
MAKSEKKGTSAAKMAEGNIRVRGSDIETAATSTMEPADYSGGYPHQRNLIYQGKFSISKGKPGGK